MPLSEFERRELERISLDLEEDDPGLAVLLSQDPVPRFGRTRIGRGLTALLAGLCILVVGLLLKAPLVGVTGFAVMCAAGYWTTRNLRGIFAGGGSILVEELRTANGVPAAVAGSAIQRIFALHLDKENRLLMPFIAGSPELSLADSVKGLHELTGESAHHHRGHAQSSSGA